MMDQGFFKNRRIVAKATLIFLVVLVSAKKLIVSQLIRCTSILLFHFVLLFLFLFFSFFRFS